MKSPTPKTTKAGRQIAEALEEILDARRSGVPLRQRFVVHSVEVREPATYDAAAVRQTRDRLGVSQAIFAQIVGVSLILAQSWEQGKRHPNAPCRRILDEINRRPKYWADMVRHRPASAA